MNKLIKVGELTREKSALYSANTYLLLNKFTTFSQFYIFIAIALAALKCRMLYPFWYALMNYPIPTNPQEMIALRQQPLNEELVASAIAGVVQIARSRSQSLDELKAEVLADDNLLDLAQRRWLSDIVTQVWENLPSA